LPGKVALSNALEVPAVPAPQAAASTPPTLPLVVGARLALPGQAVARGIQLRPGGDEFFLQNR